MLILPDYLIATPGQPPLKGWGVRIQDEIIVAVDQNDRLRNNFPSDLVRNASGQVLSPGFVNTHTHLYGVLAHGIPLKEVPSGFYPFLNKFWWPRVEDQLDHEQICVASESMIVEMLKSGTTTLYDCLEGPNSLPGSLQAQFGVVERLGVRAILSFEATERVSKENGQLGLKENADFIRATRKKGGLISGLMCFHTTFSCSADFICQAFAMAEDLDVAVHMHCSEGTYEPEQAIRNFGLRPMAYYQSLGVLGPRMLASQCVQISPEEIQLMAAHGVRMSHMPLSNCEVGGGIAPVPDLLNAGVRVGLGSDGYINDFFEVMRGAFLIHKAYRQDPGVMPAAAVWYLATEGGAHVLGLDKVGRIEPGWQADIQLIDAQFPTPLEPHNLYDQLLLQRNHTHVSLVMVAGKILVEGGKVLGVDEESLRQRTQAAAQLLWEKSIE
jgi:cytosine/adenosine deaminase-related metal-dependent hydrolase